MKILFFFTFFILFSCCALASTNYTSYLNVSSANITLSNYLYSNITNLSISPIDYTLTQLAIPDIITGRSYVGNTGIESDVLALLYNNSPLYKGAATYWAGAQINYTIPNSVSSLYLNTTFTMSAPALISLEAYNYSSGSWDNIFNASSGSCSHYRWSIPQDFYKPSNNFQFFFNWSIQSPSPNIACEGYSGHNVEPVYYMNLHGLYNYTVSTPYNNIISSQQDSNVRVDLSNLTYTNCTCHSCSFQDEQCFYNFTLLSDNNNSFNITYTSEYWSRYMTFTLPDNFDVLARTYTVPHFFYDTNPIFVDKRHYNWSMTESLYVVDEDGLYSSLNYSFEIDMRSESTTSLEVNYTSINFTFSNLVNVSIEHGYIAPILISNTGSFLYNFTDSSDSVYRARFGTDFYNNSRQYIDFTYTNHSALYNITVLGNYTHRVYYTIQDASSSAIEGAIVELWSAKCLPLGTFCTPNNIISRAITGSDGNVNFYLDSNNRYYQIWIYTADNTALHLLKDYENNSFSPDVITVSEQLESMWGFASRVPRYYWNLSNLPISISYAPSRNVYFRTHYMINNSITKIKMGQSMDFQYDLLRGMILTKSTYVDLLEPGIHYDDIVLDDINILFYLDDRNVVNRTISYYSENVTDIANIEPFLVDDNFTNWLLFLALIVLCIALQILFRSQMNTVGVHAFLVGSLFLSFFSLDFIYTTLLSLSYYVLTVVKGVVGSAQ